MFLGSYVSRENSSNSSVFVHGHCLNKVQKIGACVQNTMYVRVKIKSVWPNKGIT